METQKKRTLFLLLGIFVILVVLFFSISWLQKRQAKEKAARKEANQIGVTDLDGLSAIEYTDASDKNKDPVTYSFKKEDDVWQKTDDKELPLVQSYFSTMESVFSSLTATREIKDPDDPADYGLDDPSYKIKLTNTEGEVTTLSIGNAADEDYYLMLNDHADTLYTVASNAVSCISYDLDTLIEKDTLPSITTANVTSATITTTEDEVTYKAADDTVTDGGADSDGNAADEAGKSEDAADAEETDSEDSAATKLDTIMGGFGVLSLTDCVSYHASNEELTSYGLLETKRTDVALTWTDENDKEQTYHIYVGGADKDGENRYVQVQDSEFIYLVPADTIDNLLGGTTEGED